MSKIKNHYHDEIEQRELEDCEGDFCHEEYDIVEPALTNEPMYLNPPF